MNDLKPCPFCGGKAILFVRNGVSVVCTKCYARTISRLDTMEGYSNAVEGVIKAWNRRADNGTCADGWKG